MFERKIELFSKLSNASPSMFIKQQIADLGLTLSEADELLYNPTLILEGEINDFQKVIKYRPLTEDCATKLGLLFGDYFPKEMLLILDTNWKYFIEKEGLPVEAYNDFFEYCFGYSL